jgi:hypothetical protein
VALDDLQPADYGVWVVAAGYGARFVAPVVASREKPTTEIPVERTGALVVKTAPGLLERLKFPYLVYRISDEAGRAMFPGGEHDPWAPLASGATRLFGKGDPTRRVDVVPPGRYTIEWEIHLPLDAVWEYLFNTMPRPTVPLAAHRGKASFEIRKGAETVLELSPGHTP